MTADLNILAGCLIDGTGSPEKKGVFIRIKNGFIQDIIEASLLKTNDSLTDLSQYTVIPALSDCHLHLAWSGTPDQHYRKNLLNAKYDEAEKTIRENLNSLLNAGILYARDGGDKFANTLEFKRRYNGRYIVKISCAGEALHKPGNYGGIIGREIRNIRGLKDFINKTKGIDHIKIVNSGLNSLTQFGVRTKSQFDKEELRSIVETARQSGLPVMVHANGEIPVKNAIEAGCSSIEHGFFMGRDNLKRMADTGVFWVPTAVTMKAYNNIAAPESIEQKVSGENLNHQIEQIALAREYGVRIASGTDAGSPGIYHGKSVYEELGIFLRAGFTATEAVRCAAQTASSLLNLKNSGIISKGMKADFIAFHCEPEIILKERILPERIFGAGEEIFTKCHSRESDRRKCLWYGNLFSF